MMQIKAQPTGANYATALTMGPANFEAITVSVFNAAVIAQVYKLASSGHVGAGIWDEELLVSPGANALTLSRCGGVRFRTNPDTPDFPGVVNGWAWKRDEPRISGAGAFGSLNGGSASPVPSAITVPVLAGFGPGASEVTIVAGFPNQRIQLVQQRLGAILSTPGATDQAVIGWFADDAPVPGVLGWLFELGPWGKLDRSNDSFGPWETTPAGNDLKLACNISPADPTAVVQVFGAIAYVLLAA